MDVSEDNRSWIEICDEDQLSKEVKISDDFNVNKTSEKEEILDYHETAEKFPQINEVVNTADANAEFQSSTPVKTDPKLFEACNSKLTDNTRIVNALSYAKVVSQGVKNEDSTNTECNIKAECNLTTEDLSLTSHLDVFHVESPRKDTVSEEKPELEIFLNEDTVMFSPCKPTNENTTFKNTKRPFMLIDSPVQEPRKQKSSIHSTHKIAKSKVDSDVHSSTKKKDINSHSDILSSTKEKDVSSPSSKRELEVNPEVLSRRQKQIDYGKNTLGYERYVKIIPKHRRIKENPKTPPKHLKMSRRAWDGLIKNWRMKLHKWDPASENDNLDIDSVNSEFSFSSEDPSSYDSISLPSDSTVSTPKQGSSIIEGEVVADLWNENRPNKSENSKELWSKCPKKPDKSDDDEYLGCEPLNENCVKACS